MKRIGKIVALTVVLSLAVVVTTSGILPFIKPTTLVAEELENVHMDIKGMSCSGCSDKVQSSLSKLPEVKGSNVKWQKGTADIKVAKGSDHTHLVQAVKDAGFTVSSLDCQCKGKK